MERSAFVKEWLSSLQACISGKRDTPIFQSCWPFLSLVSIGGLEGRSVYSHIFQSENFHFLPSLCYVISNFFLSFYLLCLPSCHLSRTCLVTSIAPAMLLLWESHLFLASRLLNYTLDLTLWCSREVMIYWFISFPFLLLMVKALCYHIYTFYEGTSNSGTNIHFFLPVWGRIWCLVII